MLRFNTAVLCFLLTFSILQAQEDSSSNMGFVTTVKFDGLIKSKFEYADKTNSMRFSVRNARLGGSGNINSLISYRALIELSNEGKFSVLDLYGAINPIEGLIIRLGQTIIPIHNAFIKGPGDLMFANRAFIGKYLTPGLRDIGVSASYDFKVINIPVGIDAALFNGNDINNPIWTSKPSYSTRLRLGNKSGFCTTAKIYKLPKDKLINFMFYGYDIRYEANNWKVEAEIMQRENIVDNDNLLTTNLQGAYWIPLHNNKLFKNIIYASRWDAMDSNQTKNEIDINRLTLGLGFSFTPSPFKSLLRIDYEFYCTKNDLQLFDKYQEMNSNKLSVEILLTF